MLKISGYNYRNYSINKNTTNINNPKIKLLNKDTISFGYINAGPVPKDIQLYRAVGPSEVEALLEGDTIPQGCYVTSSPMGWLANNWLSAFGSERSDVHFITFKTNSLNPDDFMDRRDSLNDTRYGIGEYSLKNVKNIRKGFNTHGELIYAENFEKAKEEDIKNKKSEIKRLIRSLQETSQTGLISKIKNMFHKPKLSSQERNFLILTYHELASYTKEFPEIVDDIKPIAEQSPEQSYYFIYLIDEANRKEDVEYVKHYIDRALDNGENINDRAIKFIGKQGSKDDVPFLLKNFERDQNLGYEYATAISKLYGKDDSELLETFFKNTTLKKQQYLFSHWKHHPKGLEMSRFILDKYKDVDKDSFFDTKKDGFRDAYSLISDCAYVIWKKGNEKEDIARLLPYLKNNNNFEHVDVKFTIEDLSGKY